MGAYPDGMQRLTLLACIAAALGALALPSVAAAPSGWRESRGVDGSFTVIKALSLDSAFAGGLNGRLVYTEDAGATWTATTPPSSAGLRDIATSDGTTFYALDNRGAIKRSEDSGTTWDEPAQAPDLHPRALVAWKGGHLLIINTGSLLLSSDSGDTFDDVTPNVVKGDVFRGGSRVEGVVSVFGPRTLLLSQDSGRTWTHMKLPPLQPGDTLIGASFVGPRTGFVLSSFRHVYRTRDAGNSWTDLLSTGGAGADISFSDPQHGWLTAPGFANRFDGYVLHTEDGGDTWRPQPVSSSFLSKVAATDGGAFAIGNQGSSLFATDTGGEAGKTMTVGFRPVPRRVRRGDTVTIRGRINPSRRGVGVTVTMFSEGRWIARYVSTGADGVFTQAFKPQRRAWFIVQVATGPGHTSAATRPIFVPVGR